VCSSRVIDTPYQWSPAVGSATSSLACGAIRLESALLVEQGRQRLRRRGAALTQQPLEVAIAAVVDDPGACGADQDLRAAQRGEQGGEIGHRVPRIGRFFSRASSPRLSRCCTT
jgi:hypothetical protein